MTARASPPSCPVVAARTSQTPEAPCGSLAAASFPSTGVAWSLTPYTEQILAGYDPSKNHVRPQWPQHSSPQSVCPAQQQQSTVHLLRLSPSDPSIYTYAGHIGELEKAKRCLASDPASANNLVEPGGRSRTLSASQILLRASPLPSGLRSAAAHQ